MNKEANLAQGTEISPVSLRPKTWDRKAEQERLSRQDEADLREQAVFLGIHQSPGGKLMLDLIQDQMIARIEVLIKADAEAAAYMGLINALGARFTAAEEAVKKLYERNFGKETP